MKRFFLILGIIMMLFSCRRSLNNVDCSKINATYSNTILPLVKSKCVSCHFTGNIVGAPLDYNLYSDLKAVADNGKLEDRTIGQADMPPKKKLSLDDRKKIKCWIKNGAPNN